MSHPRLAALVLFLPWAAFCADDVLNQVSIDLRDGRIGQAIASLQAVVSREPASIPANYMLAETLLDGERVGEADAVIRKAVAVSPDSADLHQAQGDIEYRKGNIRAAQTAYKAAFQLDPKQARAIYGIARVFQCTALNARAAFLFRQAHDLDPHDEEIVGSFARFSARDDDEAIAALQKYLSAARGEERRRLQSVQARIEMRKFLNGRRTWILASPYSGYSIPIVSMLRDANHLSGLALAVAVNNSKPATLQLDTGASGVIIGKWLAERAGVRRIAELDLNGIGNNADPTGYLGYAEKITIGDIEFQNCVVHVSDRKPGLNSDGFVGTDIFERFLVTIDFHNRKVRLAPLPGPAWDGETPADRYSGPELKGFVQFFRFGHNILLPTSVSGGQPAFFLIDTGATLNMIAPQAAGDVTKVHRDDDIVVKGLSGSVKTVYSADKVQLQFAGFRQTHLDLVSFDLSGVSRSAGTEVSGIMGLPLLMLFTLTIDYRDGMIHFDYKPPL